MFADYIGTKHAVMVNSGSSANLLALSVLSHPGLKVRIGPGDEVIVPAIPWSTTVFPILTVCATPVFVDVQPETYNVNPYEIRKAITSRTKAIMVVHLLGNPAKMDRIIEIAEESGLFVIEDACEAHGASIHNRKVGSFGHIGTFSFFFSHHISTIEGGILVTNSDEYADLARSMRAHGWIREMRAKDTIARDYPEIDSRYLFVTAGYNLRPTEIQGAFGVHQISKLEPFIESRRRNAAYWNARLERHSHFLETSHEPAGCRHVWFGYPIVARPGAPFTRAEFVSFLEAQGIETRPIMAGNMEEHPVMRLYQHRCMGDLPRARYVARHGFFFGSHHGVKDEERANVADRIDQFLAGAG
jgi:CDP-6-deoxy-D-xylo-4-hexulose-3-dehydrase